MYVIRTQHKGRGVVTREFGSIEEATAYLKDPAVRAALQDDGLREKGKGVSYELERIVMVLDAQAYVPGTRPGLGRPAVVWNLNASLVEIDPTTLPQKGWKLVAYPSTGGPNNFSVEVPDAFRDMTLERALSWAFGVDWPEDQLRMGELGVRSGIYHAWEDRAFVPDPRVQGIVTRRFAVVGPLVGASRGPSVVAVNLFR